MRRVSLYIFGVARPSVTYLAGVGVGGLAPRRQVLEALLALGRGHARGVRGNRGRLHGPSTEERAAREYKGASVPERCTKAAQLYRQHDTPATREKLETWRTPAKWGTLHVNEASSNIEDTSIPTT